MGPSISKKRKVEDRMQGKVSKPKKRSKKQLEYHSSSSEDEGQDAAETSFRGVNLQDSDSENEGSEHEITIPEDGGLEMEAEKGEKEPSLEQSEADSDDTDHPSGSDSDASIGSSNAPSTAERKKTSKRNDPTAFSTSMAKILSTKLSTSARADPVLSRSKTAAQTSSELANEKLEARARAKLRAEKKEELDRGRIRDVLGVERGDAGNTADQEKRLRKVAQRGVVKLFNAVRVAQVRGEEAAREERKNRSIIGMGEREKAVNEVSKQGFLELIHGKGGRKLNIEEA